MKASCTSTVDMFCMEARITPFATQHQHVKNPILVKAALPCCAGTSHKQSCIILKHACDKIHLHAQNQLVKTITMHMCMQNLTWFVEVAKSGKEIRLAALKSFCSKILLICMVGCWWKEQMWSESWDTAGASSDLALNHACSLYAVAVWLAERGVTWVTYSCNKDRLVVFWTFLHARNQDQHSASIMIALLNVLLIIYLEDKAEIVVCLNWWFACSLNCAIIVSSFWHTESFKERDGLSLDFYAIRFNNIIYFVKVFVTREPLLCLRNTKTYKIFELSTNLEKKCNFRISTEVLLARPH